jgi:hypothetical protein
MDGQVKSGLGLKVSYTHYKRRSIWSVEKYNAVANDTEK